MIIGGCSLTFILTEDEDQSAEYIRMPPPCCCMSGTLIMLEISSNYVQKVQQRAAHWVLNDYGRFSSVTSMLGQLSWPTLQTHYN